MGLDGFRTALESWAEGVLRPYIDALRIGSTPIKGKEFNDPIWGTLVLRPIEVALLDSPLLQRLRRIRQLGVVDLIYPAATHTRLEHSLGTVYQIDRIVLAINERSSEEVIPGRYQRLLRIAGLCHDIGHGAMSHVSEYALKALDADAELRLEFADDLQIEEPKLSEIAAYLLIRSPAFREMFKIAAEQTSTTLPAEPVEKISDAIIGSPIYDKVPLLNELVSGPFDADKLDYLPRDAHMCGVPVVTDIPRLVQKVRAVSMERSRLPRDIQQVISGTHPAYWVLGIDLSGGRTLDELILARILLFDKLYRHQKVRAAESMVTAIFGQLTGLVDEPAMMPFALDDATILDINADLLDKALGTSIGEDSAQLAIVADLSHRLRERRLFGRAYAFAQNMPLDPFREEQEHSLGLSTFIQDCLKPQTRLEIEAKIAEETEKLIRALGKDDLLQDFPAEDLRPYVQVSPPRAPDQAGTSADAYLISGQEAVKFKDEAAETIGWSNAYLLTRDIGYIFAPRDICHYVYLAAEKHLRSEYQIKMPGLMLDYAKQDSSQVGELRKELGGLGYYDEAPFDLRPLAPRLEKADVIGRLDEIRLALAGYSGPVLQSTQRRAKVGSTGTGLLTRERMLIWLSQFGDEELIDGALRVLERVKLISRESIVGSLETFITDNPEFQGATLAVLGSAKDSSSVASYFGADLASRLGVVVATSLEDALGRSSPILFLDDFIGTGHQAISILEDWLEETPTTDLKEDRHDPLPEAKRAELRTRKLGMVFAAGVPEGANTLKNRATELSLDATVQIGEVDLPTIHDSGTFRNTDQAKRFKERAGIIGHQLIRDDDAGHDEAWADARSLGYGNQGYLVVSFANTPSQALTCLWASGVYSGVEWLPIFPRRKKT